MAAYPAQFVLVLRVTLWFGACRTPPDEAPAAGAAPTTRTTRTAAKRILRTANSRVRLGRLRSACQRRTRSAMPPFGTICPGRGHGCHTWATLGRLEGGGRERQGGWWMGAEPGFVEFAAARSATLFRTAWLLTGDWHLAQDLVQETLGRLYVHWGKVAA